MAIYHLSVKTVSRSAGRSATGAAAYRSGEKIIDHRTGEIHDYTRKQGVESAFLVPPENAPAWASDREQVWNEAEQAERRKNSTVAREFEIALPSELSADKREALAREFARELVARHGCIADVAIHAPARNGDNRNFHAHILLSTRRLTEDGFGEKTRELDDQKTGPQLVTEWRGRFADMQNDYLKQQGIEERVDHRTLEAQGITREVMPHLGPAATAIRRRIGKFTKLENRILPDKLKRITERRDLDKQIKQIGGEIAQLSAELKAARAQMQEQKRPEPVVQDTPKVSGKLPGQSDLEKMPLAELRELVEKSRVPLSADLADRDPVVVATKGKLDEIEQSLHNANTERSAADWGALSWKEKHPKLAKLHGSGLWGNKTLQQFEEKSSSANEAVQRLEPAYRQTRKEWEELRRETIRRIDQKLAPDRDFYHKASDVFSRRERAEMDKDILVRKFADMAGKRGAKALEWRDTGSRWKSVPDALKRDIERFNALSPKQKTEELARIRQQPEAIRELQKHMEAYRQKEKDMDRGMSL